ncbi:MAG: DNA-3-methyladenine glycosylase 2 family protein [Candidatus Aenigmarchaeota archaeon]|nr:DNA-3-methyladenine glycosylase 2 family protein [Candidatus Aenigmarchaeota archaeon]
MSKKAAEFLRKDRKLRNFIDANGVQVLRKRKDYFNILVFSIANQQLSGKAAATIYRRLKKLCKGRVTPKRINKLSTAQIRRAGFSYPKVSYIKDLSKKFMNKEISAHKFHLQSDKDVLDELIKIKGIGRWTAEMFLMFSLGREDIFPADDLGIKKAIKKIYGIKDTSSKSLDKFSRRWTPYRSYASLYLWKSTDIKEPKDL